MAHYQPEQLDPTIGARIREFAIRVYGSLKAFAQAADLHPVQLSKYVQNQGRPGFDVLQRFHAAGMSIDWLLTGRGEWLRERLIHHNPENSFPGVVAFLQGTIQELEEHRKQQTQLPKSNRADFH